MPLLGILLVTKGSFENDSVSNLVGNAREKEKVSEISGMMFHNATVTLKGLRTCSDSNLPS